MAQIQERMRSRSPLAQGLANAAKGFFSRQVVSDAPEDAESNLLDQQIKYNQLRTGTPEFKMKEAQVRADMNLQNALDLEDAKIMAERARRGLTTPNSRPDQIEPVDASKVSPSGPRVPPVGPLAPRNIPRFIQTPPSREYDSKVGMEVEVPGKWVENPDYSKRFEIQAAEEAARKNQDILRSNAQDNLSTIQEVKKGAKYFGPFGDLPTVAAPSSLFGGYGSRVMWESNINKLLSQKVIDTLNEMKQASKTGASGFGQLTEKELKLLTEASTALNRKLLPDQAIYYLEEMEKIQKKFLGQDSGNESTPSFNTPEEADASGLAPGTVVLVNGRRYEI